jgi:hypothetical protein
MYVLVTFTNLLSDLISWFSQGGEFKCDTFDIVRTFINATMYPQPAQQKNKNINNKWNLKKIWFHIQEVSQVWMIKPDLIFSLLIHFQSLFLIDFEIIAWRKWLFENTS